MTKKVLLFIPLGLFLYLIYLALTGTLPMALDIVTGVYYPWLNNRYLGLSTWTPVHNPYISDVTSQAVVWRLFLTNHLSHFSSIFWHNFSLSGYPYLGSAYLTPLLHPSTLLLLLPDSPLGISLVLLFQLLMVFLAAVYFFRSLRIDLTYAYVGAFALAVGGQMATWFELGALNYVIGALLLCLGLINQQKFTWLPLGIFLLINSGHYQYVIYSLLVILGYSVFTRQAWGSFKAMLLGILLSSMILLPTWDLYTRSIRESDTFLNQRNHGLISFKHLPTLLNPDYYGNPSTYNYKGEEDYQEKSPYMGLVFVPLFLYSLSLWRRDKNLRFFGLLALTAFILMTDNVVSQWFFKLGLPLIGNSKGSRPLVIFDLAMVISAVLALPHLLKNKWHLLTVAILSLLISVGLFFATVPSWNPSEILALLLQPPARDAAGANVITTFRTSMISTVIGIIFAGLLALRARFKTFPLILFFGLLVFTDLSRYFLKYNTFVRREIFYPVTTEFRYLQEAAKSDLFRTEYYGTAGVPMNIWEAYGLESASGYTSIYPKRYGEFVGIVNDDKINSHPGRFVHIFRPQSPLFDLLNIKYVLLNFSDCPDGNGNNIVCQVVSADKFKQVLLKDNMAIYENSEVLPRFFFPTDYGVSTSDSDLADSLSDHAFNPRQLVLLEQDPLLPHPLGRGTIDIVEYSSTSITLDYTSDASSLLYIGNTYDPGWTAQIDGIDVPIYRANYSFSAVPVSPGDHTLTLTYTPPYLREGVWLSLLGLLLYLFQVIIKRRSVI